MQIGGRELKITPASFTDARAFKDAIGRALKGTRLDISHLPKKIKDEIPDSFITEIIDAAISVGVSDEVDAAFFKCATRTALGTDKIDLDFFEKPENREFYYPIMIEVAKVNVLPFFKGLGSLFMDLEALIGKGPKPK